MPGVDGRAVARSARESQPGACLVMVTARAAEVPADALFSGGACVVAAKPLDYEGFLAAIVECRRGGPVAHGQMHQRLRGL